MKNTTTNNKQIRLFFILTSCNICILFAVTHVGKWRLICAFNVFKNACKMLYHMFDKAGCRSVALHLKKKN